MNRWTPPGNSQINLGLGLLDRPFNPAKARIAEEVAESLRARFLARFAVPKSGELFLALALDDPRWPEMLDALAEPEYAGKLSVLAADLTEPAPAADDPEVWFNLSTGPTEFRSPSRPPAWMHFGWRDRALFASQRFREACERAGLSGLGWLPMEHARVGDPDWYEVYAEHPLGRGLDHPLIDPDKYRAAQARSKADPARRLGDPVARPPMFRDAIVIEHPVLLRILAACRPDMFRVHCPRRFVREHLPASDFAYHQWGYKADTGPGYNGRLLRPIYCNGKARRALIEAGVMNPSRFEPVKVIPAHAADVEILDRTVPYPLPLPVYTPREAAAERARREATPKLPALPRWAFATTDEAVAALERRLAEGSATWQPAREHPDFPSVTGSELFARTPVSWQRVVPLLPWWVDYWSGPPDHESFEFEMFAPDWNDWPLPSPAPGAEEAPSAEDLKIGIVANGDWFAVRTGDPLLPADARVVHWDHETTSIKDEWPTVAAFVAEIIAACDRAAESQSG